MPLIGIVDYGVGNLRSVEKGLEKVGARAEISGDPRRIPDYDGLILPGVGAFRDAMQQLEERGLQQPVLDFIASGRQFLGICLGMQLLFDYSDEYGRCDGLGVVPGGVVRLPDTVKVPHMGWNVLRAREGVPLFRGIEDGSRFYFVHSYYCAPADDGWVAGTTPYGLEFTSAVGRDTVWGLQFHPEKSSLLGLRILANFSEMAAGGP